MNAQTAVAPDIEVLFQPIQVADLSLPNRVVMAPLIRNRASAGNLPTALNATCYAQRQCRPDHQRSDPYLRRRPGPYRHAVHPFSQTERQLEAGHRCGARPGRTPRVAVVARGTHLAHLAAAGRQGVGGAIGDPRRGQDLRRRGLCGCLDASRARTGRNPRPDQYLSSGQRQRDRGRFRRRASACRQWLSDRSVSASNQAEAPPFRLYPRGGIQPPGMGSREQLRNTGAFIPQRRALLAAHQKTRHLRVRRQPLEAVVRRVVTGLAICAEHAVRKVGRRTSECKQGEPAADESAAQLTPLAPIQQKIGLQQHHGAVARSPIR